MELNPPAPKIPADASPQTARDALVVRAPAPGELARLVYLFRNLPVPAGARLLGALRRDPIERFVAGVAWWPEAEAACFRLACQPGVPQGEAAAVLMPALASAAGAARLRKLQHDGMLADQDPWSKILHEHGFEKVRTEISFEVAYADAWNRVMRLFEKYREEIPPSWHTEPIRNHDPETILELVAPHCLMPPPEIRSHWLAPPPSGFDPDLSCILLDGQRAFGAFLLRRVRDFLYIEVQVVDEPNARQRSLADLCLLHHDARRLAPGGQVRRIQFRSGQSEHRQTANLARRMGGHETARRHLLGKDLKS